MIRIPFTADSQTSSKRAESLHAEDAPRSGGKSQSLEVRMDLLESKLEVHARDLKSRVTERVERIESRIHRAMNSLCGEAEEDGAENVVEFVSGEKSLHHLPTTSAISALNELNATLQQTKEHLDALSQSVARMRQSIPR